MADIVKKATRVGYADGLLELGKTDPNVLVLDADLAGATQTCVFKKEYPDRFYDAGIAEGNLMGVAAGLSLTGYTVFASSFAMFAAGRAFEQIRNSIGYPHLNVKIAATHAGISVGEDGASHQCNEDIGLMRTIPGMVILNPADAVEAKKAVLAAAAYEGPVYLRFGRLAVPQIFDDSYEFTIGKAVTLREGKDVAILATGLMVNEANLVAEELAKEGISAKVVNIATIKPLDEKAVREAAETCGCVVTAEEHNIIGGLGSAVAEVLSEQCPTPLVRVGVEDTYGKSGPAVELLHLFGLDAAHIVTAAKAAIAKKK